MRSWGDAICVGDDDGRVVVEWNGTERVSWYGAKTDERRSIFGGEVGTRSQSVDRNGIWKHR